jgi:hypothetical protein
MNHHAVPNDFDVPFGACCLFVVATEEIKSQISRSDSHLSEYEVCIL